MKKSYFLLMVVISLGTVCDIHAQDSSSHKEIIIHMVGNSTMADKPFKNGNPEKGWGQLLSLYFKEGVKVINYAKGGRSTKSFINEGRWSEVLNNIRQGDYLIIEFGHNDQKIQDSTRYAEANTDYRNNLLKFINESRNKGGIPVLATPIQRRRFDSSGTFYDTHGDYPKVVREIASDMNVILLDLHKRTQDMLIQYGPEKSKQLFLHIDPFEYGSLPDGKKDDTHLSPTGAFKVCDLAIEEIRKLIPNLALYLKE